MDIGKVQTEEVIDEVEVDGREEEEATEVVKTVGLLSAKRRRKVKNASSEAKNSKICAEDRQADKGASTDESGSDEYVSDGSEVLGLTSSQQRTQYTADRISVFLKQTKNQHKVKMKDFFPNLLLFCSSARLHISQKEVSGLTDQEVFRLKKLVLKAKKQMNSDDGKCSNVCLS